MRILLRLLLFSVSLNIALAQQPSLVSSELTTKIRIHRLTIDASNLPNEDREQITRSLEHHNYLQDELQDRIRIAFRDLGYINVHVDAPRLASITQAQQATDADVSVKVDQGTQYHLADIRFVKARLFPADRLRPLFKLQPGDAFDMTTFSKGLEDLRQIYATKGYINCVANPVVLRNESHRTIDLILEIDEGNPFDFGHLLLNGKEPHTGAGHALTESWKTLQGKRFNPDLLKTWLVANTSSWPGAAASHWDFIQQPSGTVDVRLLLP